MTTNRSDEESGGSRRRWLVGAMMVLAVPLTVIWWPGCRQYPAVSSKESLELMKLLYSACNTKDEKRLGAVVKRIEKLNREGKMAPNEWEGFDAIIGMARVGKWENAEEAAFKFAQDQVGVGHPDPDARQHDLGKKNKSAKAVGK